MTKYMNKYVNIVWTCTVHHYQAYILSNFLFIPKITRWLAIQFFIVQIVANLGLNVHVIKKNKKRMPSNLKPFRPQNASVSP